MKDKESTLIKKSNGGVVDRPLFIASLIILVVVSIPIILFPEKSIEVVTNMNNFICKDLGWYYIWFAVFTVIFCLFIGFSKYGRIKMGDPDDKPEYSTFSWAAMLFCGGIGGTVIYWGFIEWIYYYIDPPFGAAVGSAQAAEISAAFAPFHWGVIAWTTYIVAAAAAGYLLYVRKSDVYKISEVCRSVLGKHADGFLGKVMDLGFMFGLVAGAATSFGLGTPLLAACMSTLFGIPDSVGLKLGILITVAIIFGITSYMGISKGMKRVSDANVTLTLFFLLFLLVVGDTVFILNMGTTAIGYMVQNFVYMTIWLDPVEITNGFPENWTVFFWAYAVVYGPFYGMFFAKISKGRTIRAMIGGTVLFGTLGCTMVFSVLGNFSMSKHLSGEMDMVASLNDAGPAQTIINTLQTLPAPTLVIAVVMVIVVFFMVTTYDATSGILATVSQSKLDENRESIPAMRLIWAALLVLLPSGFVILGSPLNALQTIVIVCALPLSFIVIVTAIAFFKMVNEDEKAGRIKLQ